MPRRTLQTEYNDQTAHELRQQGHDWRYIAQTLGLSGESVARAAATRYRRRWLGETGHNPRRSDAGRRAAILRHHPPTDAERRLDGGRTVVHLRGYPPTDAERIRGDMLMGNISTQPTLLPFDQRTFGVEIEFKGIPKFTAAELVAAALGVDHIHSFPYHATARTGEAFCQTCRGRITDEEKYSQWKLEADGSVTRYGAGGQEIGGELVSPVLTIGEGGLETVKKVVTALREGGAKVDKWCGLHVHIGVKDMTGEQRANIVHTWTKLQQVIASFVSKSRRNNRFCRYIGDAESEYLRTLYQGQNPTTNDLRMRHDKYRTLNTMPFPKIGTFEVRVHQGTLNATKVTNWVQMLVSLFDAIAQGERFTLGDHGHVTTFLDTLKQRGTIKQTHKTYFTKRAQALGLWTAPLADRIPEPELINV